MDQENYFRDMMEKIKESETPRSPDHESTRVGEVEIVVNEHDPLNLTNDINSVNRLSKNSAKIEFLKKYLVDKIPVWRALQESKTSVNEFGKLTSEPNQKPNGTQSKGTFLASTHTTNTNQSRPQPNQASPQRHFPGPIKSAQK